MPLYIAPVVQHPIRPNGIMAKGQFGNGPHSTIYLGNDIGTLCLYWTPRTIVDAEIQKLVEDKGDTIPGAVRGALANRLGIVILGGQLTGGDLLGNLMTLDRGKWDLARPSRVTGKLEVRINNEIWYSNPRDKKRIPVMDPSDNFNRADESPLGNGDWTTVGGEGLRIVSNQCVRISDNTDNASRFSNATFDDDQFGEILVVTRETGSEAGPGVGTRADTGGAISYYAVLFNAIDECELFRYVTGTFASISTGGIVENGDTGRQESEGSTIRVLVNGSEQLSVTDTNLTGGQAMMYHFANDPAVADDFNSGNLGAVVVSRPKPVVLSQAIPRASLF